jgi:hypothetical protein
MANGANLRDLRLVVGSPRTKWRAGPPKPAWRVGSPKT